MPLTLPSHATMLAGSSRRTTACTRTGAPLFPADRATLATVLKGHGYATGGLRGRLRPRPAVRPRAAGSTYTTIASSGGSRARACSSRSGPARSSPRPPRHGSARQPGPSWPGSISTSRTRPTIRPLPIASSRRAGPTTARSRPPMPAWGAWWRRRRRAPGGRLVVAVTADHGEALGDHGELTHGFFVYQSTLRVPLVLAGPGVPVARRSTLARTVDITADAPRPRGRARSRGSGRRRPVRARPRGRGLRGDAVSRNARAGPACARCAPGR